MQAGGCLGQLMVFFDLILQFLVEILHGLIEGCGFILKHLDSDLLVGCNLGQLMIFFNLILQFLVELMYGLLEFIND